MRLLYQVSDLEYFEVVNKVYVAGRIAAEAVNQHMFPEIRLNETLEVDLITNEGSDTVSLTFRKNSRVISFSL